jgi:hypothetical protein
MGISMAVISTSDAELRRFQRQPDALESECNALISRWDSRVCHLSDDWGVIHALLTPPGVPTQLPTGALLLGEIVFENVSDPTHAIGSHMTKRFARCMGEIDRPTLRMRFDDALSASGGWGSRGSLGRMRAINAGGGLHTESAFGDAMSVLQRLRDYAAHAADRAEGLVFCRFEDW